MPRVVTRSTRATIVTSWPSTRADRSVSLPGSKYRRGTKSSRSPTVCSPRCLANGLADGWPTTLPRGVDRSATSLDSQQQRIGCLTAVDDGDLQVAVTGPCRVGDQSRQLRPATGAADHGEQLPSTGQEAGSHLRADLRHILAHDYDITIDHTHDVTALAPSDAGQRLLTGDRHRSIASRRGSPGHGDQVVPTAGCGLEHGKCRDALDSGAGSHDVHLQTRFGSSRCG